MNIVGLSWRRKLKFVDHDLGVKSASYHQVFQLQRSKISSKVIGRELLYVRKNHQVPKIINTRTWVISSMIPWQSFQHTVLGFKEQLNYLFTRFSCSLFYKQWTKNDKNHDSLNILVGLYSPWVPSLTPVLHFLRSSVVLPGVRPTNRQRKVRWWGTYSLG